MFKSQFDPYQSRQLIHKRDSNQWAESTKAHDYFITSTFSLKTKRNQRHSQKSSAKIDQLYIVLEKQFNQHYKEQLKRNQYKFNTHYYRALEKLGEKRTVVSEKNKVLETEYLSRPVQLKNTRQVVQYGTNHSQKSQPSTFEQTFNKTPQKEQSTQVSVQPLQFRHNIQQSRTLKRKLLQKMKGIDQIDDNPSSGRTIIKDLQELIIQRDERR